MKLRRFFGILVASALVFAACDPYKIDLPDSGNQNGGNTPTEDDIYTVKYPVTGTTKVKTLQTEGYFTEEDVAEGIKLYRMYKTEDITKAPQNVNVIEVDLDNPNYKIVFQSIAPGRSSTSAQAKLSTKTVVCLNAAYEQDAIYNKTNGVVYKVDRVEPGHLRFWKHEAALVGDGARKVGIIHGAKGHPTTAAGIKSGGIQAYDVYEKLTEKNIFASSPMLIDNYDLVGARFVPAAYDTWTISEFNKNFDGEDYRRHQGIRHPRTAVALTADNDLLLVTVDGRYSGQAEGMSARELTKFLAKHFNPQWAINMDGGGSTSMYVKPLGGIVNHICNEGSTWEVPVERQLSTFILVQKK